MRETIYIKDSRPKATERNNFSGEYDKETIRLLIEEAERAGLDPYTTVAMALQETTLGKKAVSQGHILSAWNSGSRAPQYQDKTYAGLTRHWRDKIEKNSELLDSMNYVKKQSSQTKPNPFFSGGPTQHKILSNRFDEKNEQIRYLRQQMDEIAQTLYYKELPKNIKKEVQVIVDKFRLAERIFGSDIPEDLLIQTYNGLGKIKKGYYGSDRQLDAKTDRPYGKRIQALREYAIRPNQKIDELIKTLSK